MDIEDKSEWITYLNWIEKYIKKVLLCFPHILFIVQWQESVER